MFLFGNKSWLPSLRVQWLLGALVAMLPLLAGVMYALKIMDEHHRAQSRLMIVASEVAASGVSMLDQAKDLERVSRQYQLLKDIRFKDVFQQKFEDMERSLSSISTLPTDKESQRYLLTLKQTLQAVRQDVLSGQADADRLAAYFKNLHGTIKSLNRVMTDNLQKQLDLLDERYQESQWRLSVMGAWVLPGTLILVWLVSVMVLRPIFQMSRAIRRMGKGDWQTDIKISGSNEMVSLGESLSWMQSELRTLEAQKHAFLQQVTHELKTPLAAITEAGSLLVDEVPGKLNASQRQVLSILQDNTRSLQTLIQQMLDYNSAVKESEQAIEELDFKHFLEDKLSDFKGLAMTRNVELELQGDAVRLPIDPVRVSMVVRNLVSNAVQLTPSGKLVKVCWGQQSDRWFFSVQDGGPGVLDSEKERIFEPFFQGNAQRQGSLKGSGIGLAIVKECVEFMGGTVEVENLIHQGNNCGAKFAVYIPLKKDEPSPDLAADMKIGVSA